MKTDAAPGRTMTRREILRLGLSAAALACLEDGCQKTPGDSPDQPKPKPEPTPVYRLTDGRSLYDDFDGKGCLQTFDGKNLAEPGRLSSKIWQAWTGWGTADVVPTPVETGLLAVVDEDGRRNEYGWQNREVQEVISYLVEKPRPATAFDREVLERLLNERGKAAVAGLETREIEKQVQVIQYVLNNRQDVFNERGRSLAEFLDGEDALSLARGGLRRLARKGFDETELSVVSRLAAEKQLYDNYRKAAGRDARESGGSVVRTGVCRRTERQEIKYVFDARGKLLEAVPHVPGRPYAAARKLLWTGVRNGRYAGRRGEEARIRQGRVYAEAEVQAAAGRGYVLRMTNSLLSVMSCNCWWPLELEFADFKSLSADVLLSSQSTSRSLYTVLDLHTTIPEQPPGRSWTTQIGIGTIGDGSIRLVGQCVNVNTGYRYLKRLGEARHDRWYNLRFDIVTHKDDDGVPDDQFRVDFYVDGILLASEVPEDAALLLDPNRTGVGPKRILSVYNGEENRTAVAFYDNVRAVYKDRIG